MCHIITSFNPHENPVTNYPHFLNGQTEAFGGRTASLRSQTSEMGDLGLKSCHLTLSFVFLCCCHRGEIIPRSFFCPYPARNWIFFFIFQIKKEKCCLKCLLLSLQQRPRGPGAWLPGARWGPGSDSRQAACRLGPSAWGARPPVLLAVCRAGRQTAQAAWTQ